MWFLFGGFLFRLVLGIGYVILLWQPLGLPYNYFDALSLCFISDLSIISEKETLSLNGRQNGPLLESL